MKPKLAHVLCRERLKWESGATRLQERSYLSFHGARIARNYIAIRHTACQYARGTYEKSVVSTQSQINYKRISIATVASRVYVNVCSITARTVD